MEITKNIYIDSDRKLHLSVRIGQEGSTDATITQIDIYNHKSFIDGNSIYRIENIQGNSYTEVITESNINARDQVLNSSCYATDLHHSLIIIVVSVDYDNNYAASHSCYEIPGIFTFAIYYPCAIYNRIFPTVRELEQECNAVPMNFVDGLLKKKAIDVCIEAGHYEQACKYWCKFYTHGGSTMGSSSSRGGCSCHG